MALLFLYWVFSLAMTIVIWFVQLVHYPSFKWGDKARFSEFMLDHQSRISVIVLPLMIGELITLFGVMKDNQAAWVLASASLLMIIWASTFLIQVPCHRQLSNGFDETIIKRLVASNWVRTIAWTLKLLIVTTIIYWS